MRYALRVYGAERFDRDDPGEPTVEYRQERVEPCACGGLLVADPTNSVVVLWTVRRHRRTWQHQAWLRAIGG
jgi:hypothetical protein